MNRRLRVLHVSYSAASGGAARAANRIHQAQRSFGIDSHFLSFDGRMAEGSILQRPPKLAQPLNILRNVVANTIIRRQQTPANPSLHSINICRTGLVKWINSSDFDLVNLHWVAREMLSIREIGSIAKPLFWTLHDMWPFCGAEHYEDLEEPGRYIAPYSATNRPRHHNGFDVDRWTWWRKERAWKSQKFNIIGPSRWIADCARKSALLGAHSIETIPNCVDTQIYKRLDKQLARSVLGLDPTRTYLLFGADNGTGDVRKGFHLLHQALKAVACEETIAQRTELLVFGASKPVCSPEFGLPARYIGSLADDISLALLYSAADVFVAPSMQDNLPNTVVEAMCCGTPCVAFGVGGMTDLISSEVRGRLARPFDVEDFARAIIEVLQLNAADSACACSASAGAEYGPRQVAAKYANYYERRLYECGHNVSANQHAR